MSEQPQLGEHKISSLADYLKFTERSHHHSGGPFLFRGFQDADSPEALIPKIGRQRSRPGFSKYKGPYGQTVCEKDTLQMFANRCIAFLDHRPDSLLEAMFHGQHHGLPTRLLDWTYSPLVALYFAVTAPQKRNEDKDAAVFRLITYPPNHLAAAPEAERIAIAADPFTAIKDYVVVPPYVNPRISAQQGCFTLHHAPMNRATGNIFRIRIPAAIKLELWRQLHRMGIGPAAMFPDMDGLARAITFEFFAPIAQDAQTLVSVPSPAAVGVGDANEVK